MYGKGELTWWRNKNKPHRYHTRYQKNYYKMVWSFCGGWFMIECGDHLTTLPVAVKQVARIERRNKEPKRDSDKVVRPTGKSDFTPNPAAGTISCLGQREDIIGFDSGIQNILTKKIYPKLNNMDPRTDIML